MAVIKNNAKNQQKAYAYALVAVCLWSTVATAFKLSLGYFRPEAMLFYASLTSVLVLGVMVLFKYKGSIIKSLSWQDFRPSLLLGALNPFIYYLLLIYAYDLLRAQEAQAINYTWAITMSLLSIPLLGQRMRPLQFLAIGLSYLGVVIIATKGNLMGLSMESPLGFGLAMASTVIWSLFWIFGVKDPMDPVLRLFCNFCCGLVYVGLWSLFRGASLAPNLWGLVGAIYLGIFEMGLTFVLWITALRLSQTTAQVNNLIYLSPFLSLIMIYIFVGEPILFSTLAGLGFVLAGTIVQRYADKKM